VSLPEPPLRRIVALASPILAAFAAFAVHRWVPNQQDEPLNWLASLPAWKHPYPVVLYAIALLGALGLAFHFAGLLREQIRWNAPLLAGAAFTLLVWDCVTVKRDWLHLPFFPGPDEVFGAMIEDRTLLLESAWHSLRLLLCGYAVGVSAGITTGVLIGWFPTARYWAMPYVKLLGPVPATALLAVAFALWTDAFPGAVAILAYAVWFPVNILTSSGIANVRVSYLDVARTLGANQAFLIFRVAIPAAMPHIFIGMFMGLVVSFLTLNVAEVVGVKEGLGNYMRFKQSYMEYAHMYGGLLLSAVFFTTLLTLLFKLRDWVLVWQKGVIKW
jgi:NitT/TauT family transport system permease protein